jgi:copper chaperone CopZ
MKYIISILLIISACNPKPEATKAIIANQESSLRIDGMTCKKGCVGLIEKELLKTNGVTECKIDFVKTEMIIAYDTTMISLQSIIDKISTIGTGIYKAKVLYSSPVLNEKVDNKDEEIIITTPMSDEELEAKKDEVSV